MRVGYPVSGDGKRQQIAYPLRGDVGRCGVVAATAGKESGSDREMACVTTWGARGVNFGMDM